MSKTVQRVRFSESINGLPINVNNEAKDVHLTPSGVLDEIWAWVSTASSSPTAVTVKVANVNLEFTVNSANSPVLVVPGINSSGYSTETFDPNVAGGFPSVSTMVQQSDGKILLGGGFFSVQGTAISNIARVFQDGTLDTSFNLDLSLEPFSFGSTDAYSIVQQSDGKILLGGAFALVQGTSRNRIARVFENGDLDTIFNPNANSRVQSIVQQSDGKILLGGEFTSVGGVTRNYIARVFENGALDTTFNPNASDSVLSVVQQSDGKILLGGFFTSVSGTTRNYIARVFENGALDTTFNPNANNTVYSVVQQSDGKILLGGQFTSVSGTARSRIARVFENGDLDTTFNPNASAFLRSVVQQSDGKILLGGDFTSVGGVARNFIARVFENGVLDTSFNANMTGDFDSVYSVFQQSDRKILLGGQFTSVGGASRNNIARVGLNGSISGGDNYKSFDITTTGNVVVHGYVSRIE